MSSESAGRRRGLLSAGELDRLVAVGEIDTVIVAFADMQGRLTGKRVAARLFVEEVAAHGAECCNYLLAVDVEMNTVDGYAMSSWESGYGDMVMRPDLSTLRLVPWLPGTALVMADLQWHDTSPVAAAPRSILRSQTERLAQRGLAAFIGTELEFIVFDDSYRDAWAAGYRGLRKSSDYNVDYAIHASTRLEPLLRDIRLGMDGAGMYCEGVKGECNPGQQEIAFRYDDALVTCDNHTIYKNGAKEIADQHGKSLTFMAKFDEREGNSCHIHISLRGIDGTPVSPTPPTRWECRRCSAVFWPGSWPRCVNWRCAMRRISTPTSDSPRAASPRPRLRGGSTIAPAPCVWSATVTRCEWRTGRPAETSTSTWRWRH